MVSKKIFGAIFFLWFATLLVLTYYPDFPTLKIRIRHEWFRLDYIGHFGFYAVLTMLFLFWQTGWRQRFRMKLLAITLIAGICLATITELTQFFIPGRTMNPMDLMYNCLGIVAGIGSILAITYLIDEKN
jgi:VanZ family protein